MRWEKATGSRSQSMHDCVTDILILIFTNINSQWEQLRHELMIVPVSVMLKSFFFNYKLRVAAWGFMIIKRLEIVRSINNFIFIFHFVHTACNNFYSGKL